MEAFLSPFTGPEGVKFSLSFAGEKLKSGSRFVDLQMIVSGVRLSPQTFPLVSPQINRCLGLNSIGSLRQKAVTTEILYVALPREPFGRSITRPITLTLGISSWVFLPHNGLTLLPIQELRGQHVRRNERMIDRPTGVSLL
ncbi:hypothetical protein TNCV_4074781 [Trichonephila clavipes]|nr:hypothetical protein TNCV_4074781 [Trichonephila clavipes]